jgi:hypothetical protein
VNDIITRVGVNAGEACEEGGEESLMPNLDAPDVLAPRAVQDDFAVAFICFYDGFHSALLAENEPLTLTGEVVGFGIFELGQNVPA